MLPAALLSFGCHHITGGSSLRRSMRLIHCAMDHGITRFDVAPSYGLGTAESALGRALRRRASCAEVTTKFGIEPSRAGAILAWGREPYRWLTRASQRINKMRNAPRLQQHAEEPPRAAQPARNSSAYSRRSYLGLRDSLERSLKALRLECVDTLLTHEWLDPSRMAEHLADLDLAHRHELLKRFGSSGQGEAVAQNCLYFDGLVQVIQVSVEDAHRFGHARELRCFGVVRYLGHKIADWSQHNRLYQEELFLALSDVESLKERFALAAMAASRVLFPHATLVITSSDEAHLANIVRYSGERNLLDWATAHRAVHERLFANQCATLRLTGC
jgi:aryl-alcohol dehydrogenase-like predicted oxidoreductase